MPDKKDIFEKFAALRAMYPDDVARIEADEASARALLHKVGYAQNETTKQLLALCRKDILAARMKLATVKGLSEDARRELWGIVDARMWFVSIVSQDYEGELANMEAALDGELTP